MPNQLQLRAHSPEDAHNEDILAGEAGCVMLEGACSARVARRQREEGQYRTRRLHLRSVSQTQALFGEFGDQHGDRLERGSERRLRSTWETHVLHELRPAQAQLDPKHRSSGHSSPSGNKVQLQIRLSSGTLGI